MANAITTTKEWQTNEAKPPKGTAVEWVSPQAFVFLILLDVLSWQPGAGAGTKNAHDRHLTGHGRR